ncbi:unnamed protein product [Closterium sp. Yama58-4]|nr:unnamed protein product [Closterium sp. Yama58-4]
MAGVSSSLTLAVVIYFAFFLLEASIARAVVQAPMSANDSELAFHAIGALDDEPRFPLSLAATLTLPPLLYAQRATPLSRYSEYAARNKADPGRDANCDASGNVAYLNFYMQSLKGSMPTDISQLSALTYINLCYNLLHASFTPWTATLMQMPQLMEMRFCANWFYGTIPTSIVTLTRLTTLTWVGSTGQCTGEKASQSSPYWAGVKCSDTGAVTSISLRTQGLSGSLHSSIAALATLTSLDLSSNLFNQQLDGFLSDVVSLTQLQQLLLGYNWFYGSIPTTISQLSQLSGLSLFSNYLTGSLPALPSSLRALDIAYNFLSGSLPTLPTSLSHCAAEHNCLIPAAAVPCARFGSTQRPAAMAGVTAASATERCAVCGMGTATEASVCFDGECVVTAAQNVSQGGPNGPAQAVLDLQCTGSSQTSMADATVNALLALKTALGVTSTAWGSGGCNVEGYTSGSDWPGVACDSLGNVLSIDLTSQKLKGSMASDVTALTSLTRLTFDSNLLWTPLASFVSYFSSLSNLVVLDLQYNWFYGTLPAYLLNLPALTSLALGGNYLTGTVPKPTSTTLAKLTLTNNFLTGSVPSLPCSFSGQGRYVGVRKCASQTLVGP